MRTFFLVLGIVLVSGESRPGDHESPQAAVRLAAPGFFQAKEEALKHTKTEAHRTQIEKNSNQGQPSSQYSGKQDQEHHERSFQEARTSSQESSFSNQHDSFGTRTSKVKEEARVVSADTGAQSSKFQRATVQLQTHSLDSRNGNIINQKFHLEQNDQGDQHGNEETSIQYDRDQKTQHETNAQKAENKINKLADQYQQNNQEDQYQQNIQGRRFKQSSLDYRRQSNQGRQNPQNFQDYEYGERVQDSQRQLTTENGHHLQDDQVRQHQQSIQENQHQQITQEGQLQLNIEKDRQQDKSRRSQYQQDRHINRRQQFSYASKYQQFIDRRRKSNKGRQNQEPDQETQISHRGRTPETTQGSRNQGSDSHTRNRQTNQRTRYQQNAQNAFKAQIASYGGHRFSARHNAFRPPRQSSLAQSEDPQEQRRFEPLNLPRGASILLGSIDTSFRCVDLPYGYYADQINNCQVFHVCHPFALADGHVETYKYSFMCGKGTLFDQEKLACVEESAALPCQEALEHYIKDKETEAKKSGI